MDLPDKPQIQKKHKSPTIENINYCFQTLKDIYDKGDAESEWYTCESKFHKEYKKCLFALKEENIIDLQGYYSFKFKSLGYEVYNAESYINYTIKKNILYFIIDAMKDGDNLNFDNLLNKLKPSKEEVKLKEILKDTTIRESISLLVKSIMSSMDF